MPVSLKILVLDGPYSSKEFETEGDDFQIGGRGSDAQLEILGLPDSMPLIRIHQFRNKWSVTELMPGVAKLNEKRIRPRTPLSAADVIECVGKRMGASIRLKILFSDQTVAQIKTTLPREGNFVQRMPIAAKLVAGVIIYTLLFGGLYFGVIRDVNDVPETAQITPTLIAQYLTEDIQSKCGLSTEFEPNISLNERPETFYELLAFLNSSDDAAKLRAQRDFGRQISDLFSDAHRYESIGQNDKSKQAYRDVVRRMDLRECKLTELALQRLANSNF